MLRYLPFLLLLFGLSAQAQPDALWGHRFSVSDPIFSFGKNLKFNDIATDDNGHLYLLGFHRAALLLNGDTISSPYDGAQTGFLMKMTTEGELQWYRRLTMGNMKAVQWQNGTVYVAGEIAPAEFGPLRIQSGADNSTITLLGEGNSDIFLARYDEAGTLLSTARFGGPDSDNLAKGDLVQDMIVDANGQLYFCGSYHRDFSLGDGLSLTEPSNRGKTFYLAALNEDLSPRWLQRIDSPLPTDGGNAEGLALALSGNRVSVALGYSAGGIILDDEVLLNDNQQGDRGCLLIQYDQNGNRQWFRNLEPEEGLIIPFALEASEDGQLYLGFSHEQQVLIDEAHTLEYLEAEDELLKTGIVSFSNEGEFQWGKAFFFSDADLDLGGTTGDLFFSGATFRTSVAFSSGYSLDFDGPGSTSLWGRLGADGSLRWADKPETPADPPFSTSHQSCADDDAHIYISANFNEDLLFRPDIALDNGYGSDDFDALYLVRVNNTDLTPAREAERVEALKAFPNPTAGETTLEVPAPTLLQLWSSRGELLQQHQAQPGLFRLSLQGVPAGIYTLTGKSEKGLYRTRLIKAR